MQIWAAAPMKQLRRKSDKVIYSFTQQHAFLSNFYPIGIEYEGITYDSVEHAYMAAKFAPDQVDIANQKIRHLIQACGTPGKAKRLALNYKKLWRPEWNYELRLSIMESLLRSKFSNKPLQELLLDTIEQDLIEGNSHSDTFWGQVNGVGANHLGQLLMKIRDELWSKSNGMFK